MRWYLKGPAGAIQFVVYTNWMLPADQECQLAQHRRNPVHLSMLLPLPADVGYHSHKIQYEGQEPMKCDVIGDQCYYDGSGLAAVGMFDLLVQEGSEAVWKRLEQMYHDRFDEAPWKSGTL